MSRSLIYLVLTFLVLSFFLPVSFCVLQFMYLFKNPPENEYSHLQLWKLPELSSARPTEGLERGCSCKRDELAQSNDQMVLACWNSGMHFKYKCLVTAGISEPAAGTLGQPLCTGSGSIRFSRLFPRPASLCVCSPPSVFNTLVQWPLLKKVVKLRNSCEYRVKRTLKTWCFG